jgi:hypothetical protein
MRRLIVAERNVDKMARSLDWGIDETSDGEVDLGSLVSFVDGLFAKGFSRRSLASELAKAYKAGYEDGHRRGFMDGRDKAMADVRDTRDIHMIDHLLDY